MDCQGLVARLVMDFVLLTTAVEVAGRWRELAERLTKVSRLQMDAYEAPHRDKNGIVDSEVGAAPLICVDKKLKNTNNPVVPNYWRITFQVKQRLGLLNTYLLVKIYITKIFWTLPGGFTKLEQQLYSIVLEPSTVIVTCFQNFASSDTKTL